MMAEGGIFAEDIVKNSQGTVGLVLEDGEETSDESDSEEEVLKKGQIVVCWYPSGNEETLAISKVYFCLNLLCMRNVSRQISDRTISLHCSHFTHF